MPELRFRVEGVAVHPYAVAPTLILKLKVENHLPEELIRSISLRSQIQIQARWRDYSRAEKERLKDLFGEPERWAKSLQPMLWTHAQTTVPEFRGETTVEIPLACSFDFNVAATKYFAGLTDAEVPLSLQFSGTVFWDRGDGTVQIEQIPWTAEAQYCLPVGLWKQMMDLYYPNKAWVCLERDVFKRLDEYRRRMGCPTWEKALESALSHAEQEA